MITPIEAGALTTVAKPFVEAAITGLKQLPTALKDLFTDHFKAYLEVQIEKHKYLNTIVFNAQKPLTDLYIPLTLTCGTKIKDESGKQSAKTELKISKFDMSFLPENDRVLITDTAGMGKSTLLKFLFLECIRTEYAIPIFVELRVLSEQNTILQHLERQLNLSIKNENITDKPKISSRNVHNVLSNGDFVFFLDGYDEIPFKDREIVTTTIKDFISKYSKNIFVVSSRPETGLLAFSGFKQYSIKPLSRPESYSLISKYDENGPRSIQLIEKLRGGEHKSVNEYLKNPLLTTLLYRCYEYKQNIPFKKHVFYRQVYDALYDWHDSTKDGYNTRQKKCKLDIDSFHRVLRAIGFLSVMKGKVEDDKDGILSWIDNAKRMCPDLIFNSSDFLDDSIIAVPVFIKDGSSYRWSHKSLSEYFAAQYLSTDGKSLQEKVFSQIQNQSLHERFENVLDQIYDIDNSAFRKYFMAPMVDAFKIFWETSYKGLDSKISAELIAIRKSMTFHTSVRIGNIGKIPHIKDLTETLRKLGNSDDDIPDLSESMGNIDLQVSKTSINLVISETNNGTYMYLLNDTKYSTVVKILSDKKDQLILNKHKLDLEKYKTKITRLPRKSFVKVSDDANSPLNSYINFGAVTRLIALQTIILDHQKVLSFRPPIEDERNLIDITDSLVNELSST